VGARVDGHGLGWNAGERLDTLAHGGRELDAREDEVAGDDRGGGLAVREHERLRDERFLDALRERPARGPARDGRPGRRRDVDPRGSGPKAPMGSETWTCGPITSTLSPGSHGAIARTTHTTPSRGAWISDGSRSGRSMKWTRPTSCPAETRSPGSTSVSQWPASGAKRQLPSSAARTITARAT